MEPAIHSVFTLYTFRHSYVKQKLNLSELSEAPQREAPSREESTGGFG